MTLKIGNYDFVMSSYKHLLVWYLTPSISIDLTNKEIAFYFLCFTFDVYAVNVKKEEEARRKWEGIVKMMKDDDQETN